MEERSRWRRTRRKMAGWRVVEAGEEEERGRTNKTRVGMTGHLRRGVVERVRGGERRGGGRLCGVSKVVHSGGRRRKREAENLLTTRRRITYRAPWIGVVRRLHAAILHVSYFSR